jgi:hypothetical protein
MGAYLLFRLSDPADVSLANDYLRDQPEYEWLDDRDRHFFFWSESDQEWVIEEHGQEALSFYPDLGEGKFKVSGLGINDDPEGIRERWTALFGRLHDHDGFEVEVYPASCALGHDDGDFYHFSTEQVRTITDDGAALTGTSEDWPPLEREPAAADPRGEA